MSPLGIFRRKEKEKAKEIEEKTKTLLEELCTGDAQLYRVLSRTLLLDPSLAMKEGINVYAARAREHEKSKAYIRARVAYQVAGEIALHENKLSDVQKFFRKAAEVDPYFKDRDIFGFFLKKENAERALAIAQEYYARRRQTEPSKEGSSE